MSHIPAEQVRARIDHPVIDSDGHCLEFLPAVREFVAEEAGASARDAFDQTLDVWARMGGFDADTKRNLGLFRMTWWGFPAANSLDRATAMLPRLMAERLDEFGIDHAVVYPTYGLGPLSLDLGDIRCAIARAFNRYYAESYGPHRDRLTPVAVIPMHTPEEAIAELEHCVGTLGFRAVLLAGHVRRPLPSAGAPPAAKWMDTFGLDSPYDYDPVWQKCLELGVSPTFHSSGMGWGTRASLTNYVFNHLGNFAAAGEATCRALFLGGVTRRFPALRFAFLEGGVGWACNLYSDLIGHWEKRGAHHLSHLDPNRMDRGEIRELFAKYGSERFTRNLDGLDPALEVLSNPDEDPALLDEFAACGIESPQDIARLFVEPFHFGCEADDPMNAAAFSERNNPLGARLKAVFSSDVGHWDVPDMRDVLGEAWEGVEKGLLDEADFRDFVFDNPMSLWTGTNPDFFAGTRVEDAAARWQREG